MKGFFRILGVDYHANVGDDLPLEGDCLLRDEDGDPIPATTCLCYAACATECCCGAWDDGE